MKSYMCKFSTYRIAGNIASELVRDVRTDVQTYMYMYTETRV